MNHRPFHPIVVVLLALAAAGCGPGGGNAPAPTGAGPDTPPPPAGPAWFEDVAVERGIDFTWVSGAGTRRYLPESIGGGAALLDYDGDGDLDAYLVQGGYLDGRAENPPNRLFRNDGTGTFTDVTEASGTGDRGYGMGVVVGDYDGDGDPDLYVTNLGPNVLYRNEGDGTFTDVTVATRTGDDGWSTSGAFVDYDLDGDLDLYVCSYVNWSVETERTCFNARGVEDYCAPANYDAPTRDVLYRNDGNGAFTDVSAAAGLTASFGNGLGVVFGDFNGDGRPDAFVANDGNPDQLWANQGNGRFSDVGRLVGIALDMEGKAKAGMGVTAADVDDDGDLDVMVCNLRGESDSVFLNEGQFFSDRTTQTRLRRTSRLFTRFGMAWADFDNDGHLDLYQVNGRVQTEDTSPDPDDPFAEPNLLFRGEPGPVFEEVFPRGGTAAELIHTSRAAAFGDVDGDGGLDVLVVNRDGPAYLLRNVVPDRGRFARFRVLEANGRDALGATVSLRLGDRTIRRDVRAAYSYLASSEPIVHVGLGDADTARSVTVRWTDGTTEAFGDLPADAVHVLKRGAGS